MESNKAKTKKALDMQVLLNALDACIGGRLWVRDATFRQCWDNFNFIDYSVWLLMACANAEIADEAQAALRTRMFRGIVYDLAVAINAFIQADPKSSDYTKMSASVLMTYDWLEPHALISAAVAAQKGRSMGTAYGLTRLADEQDISVAIYGLYESSLSADKTPERPSAWAGKFLRDALKYGDVLKFVQATYDGMTHDGLRLGEQVIPHWKYLRIDGCRCTGCSGSDTWRNLSGG